MKHLLIFLCVAACGTSPSGVEDADGGVSRDGGADGPCPDAAPGIPDAAPGDASCPDAAPDAPDAAPDSSDAGGGGLPEGSICDVLLDQCAAGLTCPPTDGDGNGICIPIGPQGVGEDCSSGGHADCGYAMHCTGNGPGELACRIVCDVGNPGVRCQPSEMCLAWGGVGDIGSCWEVPK
jgi:hypothetical protein